MKLMPKVMVVDDAELSRLMLSRLLQREGYEVVGASNGLEALHTLEHALPDLVLLDVMMPDLDGLQLLEIFHEHPDWKKLPVIMLSALSDTHTIRRAEQLGAKDYLVKAAFSVAEVLQVVKQYTQYVPQ
jgi:CheY-like chemotaxis protein